MLLGLGGWVGGWWRTAAPGADEGGAVLLLLTTLERGEGERRPSLTTPSLTMIPYLDSFLFIN